MRFLLLLLIVPIGWYLWCKYQDNQVMKENFAKQLGTYKIDVDKTDLGEYLSDIDLYKNLIIKFESDSTFWMNMSVPFIYDSVGIWNAGGGGLDDWNWMYYQSNKDIRTQFSNYNDGQFGFYMNSTTPQKGHKSVQEIYFRKEK